MKNPKVSIVVPLFNEEGNVELLSHRLVGILQQYKDYELLFVDDGSGDGTLGKIKAQREKNRNIHYLSFSRNFGHQNALRAGIEYASGDCIISMDGDMQHPPELIPDLVEKWQEGYDIVYTIRKDDPQISFLKRKTSNLFYDIMNKFSDIRIERGTADFRLIDNKIAQIINNIKENDVFMRGVIPWLGYKQCAIEYMPQERCWGETKYSLSKMIKLGTAGLTSFSVKPLHISTLVGYILAGISFLYGIYAMGVKLFTINAVSGWASVMTVILFIGGVQMIMLGILGEYVGKLFIESKRRPNYLIKDKSYD
ncbi:MAG: glycosyltransferase family 2 protein [Gammaproteobacteria bacterium]|nr:glycosyltransferase family 2 protein [Gammaproteobacteria bacterium]